MLPSEQRRELSEDAAKQFADAVAGVWQQAAAAYAERARAIRQALVSLGERALSEDERRAAEQHAHTLAGSLGTFGLERGSRLAENLRSALADEGLAPEQSERLVSLASELQQEIAGGP
jgi:HPt (histidine-containing phosphotransfer) domain-containing protein